MISKELLINIEKIIRIEDFGINIYSNLSRKYGKRENLGVFSEKIAKDKVACKNTLQIFYNNLKNNKIHIHSFDSEQLEKLNPDKIIQKYEAIEDDGKPYSSLVKIYQYQRELLNNYIFLLELIGVNKDLQFLCDKAQNHFEVISDFVDNQYEKYESFSSYWN